MDNEFNVDLITLISDEGEEIEFEILDIIENEEGKFYVLFPYYENPADRVNVGGTFENYISRRKYLKKTVKKSLPKSKTMKSSTESLLFLKKTITMMTRKTKKSNFSLSVI